MLQTRQILVRAIALAASAVGLASGLSACGQPGALYLPTEPAAARRATLPESLTPRLPTEGASTAPTPPASAPSTP